jgi:hypothetical protein
MKCDLLVSKFAFKTGQLVCRYAKETTIAAAEAAAEANLAERVVGLYESNSADP